MTALFIKYRSSNHKKLLRSIGCYLKQVFFTYKLFKKKKKTYVNVAHGLILLMSSAVACTPTPP